MRRAFALAVAHTGLLLTIDSGDLLGAQAVTPDAPHLVAVTPDEDDVAGLDLMVCATLDVTEAGIGPDWSKELWFEIGGVEWKSYATRADDYRDPKERTGCASLRHALERDEVASPPAPGPIDVAVRYQDATGVEHRHVWRTNFSLAASEPPEIVERVREVYGPLRDIDRGRSGLDLTIAGYYLHGDVLDLYIHDTAEPDAVRSEVEAALGDAVPSGGFRIIQPASPPTNEEQGAWIREARGPVFDRAGDRIYMATGGPGSLWNRVMYGVSTLYSAHLVREALAQTSVPQEG